MTYRAHAAIARLALLSVTAAFFLGCSPETADGVSLKPGVRIGKGLLYKQLLVQCLELDQVTDIQVGRVDGQTRTSLVLTGSGGFSEFDLGSRQLRRTVVFEPVLRPPFEVNGIPGHALDLEGDGDLEFVKLSNGPRWGGRTSFHDGDGKVVQEFSETIWSSVPIDLDEDGDLEFLQSMAGTDQVRLVDHRGQTLWTQSWAGGGPSTDVLFTDVDDDRVHDIVYANGTAVCARDASGKLLSETRLPLGGTVGSLNLLASWGDPPKDVLSVRESTGGGGAPVIGTRYLLTLDARTVLSEVPNEAVECRIDAVPVSFPDAPKLAWAKAEVLSIPAFIAGTKLARLRLRLFDASGSTLYEEVLPTFDGEERNPESACAFLPSEAGRQAQLLVGYGSRVWSFTASP